jgi:hypothetical protein
MARMFWYLHLTVSNVLHNDQWSMLEEMWRFQDGRFGWSYLWTPYWGQRIVLPRLIFLLDDKYFHFSNTPLIWVNVLALCAIAAVLMSLACRLLNGFSLLASAVIAHLVLSSLQLENIAYGGSVNYTVGLMCSVAAIVLLGRRTSWAVACAILATLSFTGGLFVWPILILEAGIERKGRTAVAILSALCVTVTSAYAIGFTNPGIGMGGMGMIRRPVHALLIAAAFLGGPLSDVRLWLGEAVGAVGFILAIYFSVDVVRKNPPAEYLALTAVCWYGIATALSIPLGRMTPEWIASRGALGAFPSRYFTAPFLFWASAFVLVLYLGRRSRVTMILAGGTGLVVAGLTVGTIRWQLWESMDWLAYYRKMDAAASGFFVGASDPAYMAEMYPDQRLLDHWVPYLKEHHLSVFADKRAEWIGQDAHRLFPGTEETACRGRVDEANSRVLGYLAGSGVSITRKTDIVFTNAAGTIAGLGRTLATEDARGGVKFLGYVNKNENNPISALAVMPDRHLCGLPR